MTAARGFTGFLLAALVAAACSTTPPEIDAETVREDRDPGPAPVMGDGSGAWRELPDAPIAPRSGQQTLWTGEELLVWGGFGEELRDDDGLALRDGARFDPATDRWTTIAPAPITADYSQHAVVAGEELLIWSNQGGSGEPTGTAAYDLTTDTWRPLPWAPVPRMEGTGAVWTGEELLVWGHDHGLDHVSTGPPGAQDIDEDAFEGRTLPAPGAGDVHLAAYDPATDRWREVPAPPLDQPRYGFSTVWTGERLVLWGGTPDGWGREDVGCEPICNDMPELHADAAAYDPAADRWETLPEVPEVLRSGWAPTWADDRALVAGSRWHAPWRLHEWDPFTGEVRGLAEYPGTGSLGPSVWTGAELLWLQERSGRPDDRAPVEVWAYDPGADAWSTLPRPRPEATRDLAMVWTGREALLWGGSVWGEGFAGGIAEKVDSGLAYDPAAPPGPPQPAPEPDFGVDVAVEVDGDLPVRFHAEEAAGLPIGEDVRLLLTAESERDVLLQRPHDGQGSGVLERGPGRLVLAGAEGSLGTDPAHPQEGIQVWDPALLPEGLLPADRVVLHPLTLLAEDPPFAPVPGAYTTEVAVAWWEAVPPPAPYPVEPDGRATVRVTVTLEPLTEAARADRSGQPDQRRALARPPCHSDSATLTTGASAAGSAGLSVEVDGLGWFGQRSYHARSATYTSAGGEEQGIPITESVVFANGRPLRECIHPTFSFDATPVEAAAGSVRHTVAVDGLDLTVTQQVRMDGDDRAVLEQRYAFANPTGRALPLRVTRLLGIHQGAGEAGEDGAALTMVTEGPVFTLRLGSLLDGEVAPTRWVIGEDGLLSTSGEHDAEPVPGGGIPEEAHGRVKETGTLSAAQEWVTDVAAGGTVTLVTTTTITPAR